MRPRKPGRKIFSRTPRLPQGVERIFVEHKEFYARKLNNIAFFKDEISEECFNYINERIRGWLLSSNPELPLSFAFKDREKGNTVRVEILDKKVRIVINPIKKENRRKRKP